MVDVEDDVVLEVVELVVDVGAAVVTGMVVVVLDVGCEVVLEAETVEEVDPESVTAGSSLLQPTIVKAMRITGISNVDFIVGSLARVVAIT
ncbi:MAG: hypothetical protein ABI862_13150 [Ilumatobacteraceae bacterium]